MSVKGFKLTSGEEIVCQLTKSEPTQFIIEMPLMVEWQINPNAVMTYDLLPWAYSHRLANPLNLNIFSVASGPFDVDDSTLEQYKGISNKILESAESQQRALNFQKSISEPRRVSKRKA